MAREQIRSVAKGGSRKAHAEAPQAARPENASPVGAQVGLPSIRKTWIAAPVAVMVAAAIGVGVYLLNGLESTGRASGIVAATFVGSDVCASCHQAEAALWGGSRHKQAMDHATEKSVLGDFSDASFEHFGVHSRFFRKVGKFLVETDGPDGELATFEVKYTFGVSPLQQYLVELADGRIQALSVAWDARPKEQGGQRWFDLHPNEEIRHDDVLHWTKLNQNWNFMCAECHSTGVRKNYDATNDRYATVFAEVSVGCEACHGQGSRHVAWAREKQHWRPFGASDDPNMGLVERFSERRDGIWTRDAATGNAGRSSAPRPLRAEVETCGRCHARRGGVSEQWAPGQWLSDTHAVSPINRRLYHADGQILDEDYEYGSFKQSRMFAAGVTCGDCHEPHGAKLRVPGDGVCLQCHSSDKYAAVAHHQHAEVNPPLSCVSCHMPTRTYMVVDPRHDHSLRIPRPDLSAKLGTPNACNDCHTEKSADWAAAAIKRQHGPDRKGFQNYAEAFHAAWSDQADAEKLLAIVAADRNAPAIARAAALTELAPRVSPSGVNLARKALSDSDPMVRIGALDMLESLPAAQIWPLASPLLSDPIRGVRIRTASLLAAVPTANQPPADRDRFERAAAEFIAAQRFNADRPESRSALGSFFAKRGRAADAEAEYRAALRLVPQYATAAVNLADLYRGIGREVDGESVLRATLAASPQDAGLHHALGLTLVRLKRTDEALVELHRAAELDPGQTRYTYVYAVALHSAAQANDALLVLRENLERHPADRDTLQALIAFSRDSGDVGSALEYAERLVRIPPADPNLPGLIQDLRRQAGRPGTQ